jgi:hypothetical protein
LCWINQLDQPGRADLVYWLCLICTVGDSALATITTLLAVNYGSLAAAPDHAYSTGSQPACCSHYQTTTHEHRAFF